jgi:hypothetical protein
MPQYNGFFFPHNAASYKIQRTTFDIDFFLTADDYGKIESNILSLGYTIFNRTVSFAQLKSERPFARDFDFLLGDGKTVDELWKSGRDVIIAGATFKVPSPLHLIAMKLHSIQANPYRELKDFPDIVEMLKVNGIDPRLPEIKILFQKYNARELYERLIRIIS